MAKRLPMRSRHGRNRLASAVALWTCLAAGVLDAMAGNDADSSTSMTRQILEDAGIALDLASLVGAAQEHGNLIVRAMAIEWLGFSNQKGSIPALEQIAKEDTERLIRRAAALALCKLESATGPEVLRGLLKTETETGARVFLAGSMALYGDASGYEVVLEASRSDQVDMRTRAAGALVPFLRLKEQMAQVGTVPDDAFLALGRDSNPKVRTAFVQQLVLAVDAGLPVATAAAETRRLSEDPDKEVREWAGRMAFYWSRKPEPRPGNGAGPK